MLTKRDAALRKPLAPDELTDARQDNVHVEVGRARPARVVRVKLQQEARARKAEAEVERLRTALERISELTHTDDCKCQAAPIEECGCQPSMREIARAALRGEGEK